MNARATPNGSGMKRVGSGVFAIRSDSSRRHGPASCSALDLGGAMPAGELEQEIRRFIEYYLPALIGREGQAGNNERYHDPLAKVTPADVYFGRHKEVITRREELERKSLRLRKLQNLKSQHHQLQLLHSLEVPQRVS
jgi:hypothetical protein